jgi:hypothetical protein
MRSKFVAFGVQTKRDLRELAFPFTSGSRVGRFWTNLVFEMERMQEAGPACTTPYPKTFLDPKGRDHVQS